MKDIAQVRDEIINCFRADGGELGCDFDKVYSLIAEAVQGERERCIKIADEIGEQLIGRKWNIYCRDQFHARAEIITEEVAKAIREAT